MNIVIAGAHRVVERSRSRRHEASPLSPVNLSLDAVTADDIGGSPYFRPAPTYTHNRPIYKSMEEAARASKQNQHHKHHKSTSRSSHGLTVV